MAAQPPPVDWSIVGGYAIAFVSLAASVFTDRIPRVAFGIIAYVGLCVTSIYAMSEAIPSLALRIGGAAVVSLVLAPFAYRRVQRFLNPTPIARPIQIIVVHNPVTNMLQVHNLGDENITICGTQFFHLPASIALPGAIIAPGAFFFTPFGSAETIIRAFVPAGTHRFPIAVLMKDGVGQKFVARATLLVDDVSGTMLVVRSQLHSIDREDWSS